MKDNECDDVAGAFFCNDDKDGRNDDANTCRKWL